MKYRLTIKSKNSTINRLIEVNVKNTNYTFFDDGYLNVITLSDNLVNYLRKKDNCEINMSFSLNKKTEYLMKLLDEKIEIKMILFTKKILIEDNKLQISYTVLDNNDDYEFILERGKIYGRKNN